MPQPLTPAAGLDLAWLPKDAALLLPYTLRHCTNTSALSQAVSGLCVLKPSWIAYHGDAETWFTRLVNAYRGISALGRALTVGTHGVTPGDADIARRQELAAALVPMREQVLSVLAHATTGSLGTQLGLAWERAAGMVEEGHSDAITTLSACNALQPPDVGVLLEHISRSGARGLGRTELRGTMHDRVVSELVGSGPSVLRLAYDLRASDVTISVRAQLPAWDLRCLSSHTHRLMSKATDRVNYSVANPSWGHRVGWAYPVGVLHGVHGVCGAVYLAPDCGLIFVDHGGWIHDDSNNWKLRCSRGNYFTEVREMVEYLHSGDTPSSVRGIDQSVRTIDHPVSVVWNRDIAQISDNLAEMAPVIAAQAFWLIGQMVAVELRHPDLHEARLVPGREMLRFAVGAAGTLADYLAKRRRSDMSARRSLLLSASGALTGLHRLAQGLRAYYVDTGAMWDGAVGIDSRPVTYGEALVLLERELGRCACSLINLEFPADDDPGRQSVIDAALDHLALSPMGCDPAEGVYSDRPTGLRWLSTSCQDLALRVWAVLCTSKRPEPPRMDHVGIVINLRTGLCRGIDVLTDSDPDDVESEEEEMPSVGSSWDDPDEDDDEEGEDPEDEDRLS